MSNTVLTRTVSGSDSTYTYKKNTVSVWLKRSQLGAACFFEGWYSNAFATQVYFLSSGELVLNAASSTSGSAFQIVTNRKFRDVNSWYHIVISIDTTDATSTDRCKIYVNGVRETSFASASYPNQNASVQWSGTGNTQFVGRRESGGAGLYYDGAMSYLAYIDGTAELPTIFGETDTTTGQWKIKTSITPSVAWGNFGFLILKDGNSLTDASPNSNNFTVGAGTLTDYKDCPSNVLATLNPLWTQESTRVPTLTLGNNMFSGGSSSTWYQTIGTLGFSSGKYYWEAKYNAGTNLGKNLVGAVGIDGMTDGKFYEKTPSIFYKNEDGGEYRLNNSQSSGNYGTLAQNDILGCAIDMDASTPTATFYKNGTALVSNISLTGFAGKTIVPAVSTYSSGEFQMNFGNGYFGTTAVSSAGTNASGNGIFEYDTPTGYTALSTKGLNL